MDAKTRYLQIGETKNVLDDLIDEHATAYLLVYPEIVEFSPFEKSGTLNYYIGMIWTDDCEKPDERFLKMGGSYSLTRNKLVELSLANVNTQQSFFPGQIVAFQAEPFQERRLVVKKFLDPMKIAPYMKKIDISRDLNILVATGPFMVPEQEDWTLFDNLIASVKPNNVTHLILLGPLVDIENKHMRIKYDAAWTTIYSKLIEELNDYEVEIHMVPSSRDIIDCKMDSNYFYPMPKLNIKLPNVKSGANLKCKISVVSDPAQVDLDGLHLDVTSAEILLHMNKCLMFKNKQPGSPFNAIFKHIIVQGMYPLYPNPIDLAVDQVKLAPYRRLDRLGSHILILPTRFNASCSKIEDRLVVTVQKTSVKKEAILIEVSKDGDEVKMMDRVVKLTQEAGVTASVE